MGHAERWAMPSGPRYGFVWDIRAKGREPDRLVSESQLLLSLVEACKNRGVEVLESDYFPVPNWSQENLLVVESSPAQLEHWGPGVVLTKTHRVGSRARVDWAQFRLPVSGDLASRSEAWVGNEEHSLVFLEAHPEGGWVLTIMGPSRLAVERAALRLRRGQAKFAQQMWQALWLLNPSAKVSHGHTFVGESGIFLAQSFALGKTVGLYPEACNIQCHEDLSQALRLHQRLLDLSKNSSLETPVQRLTASAHWGKEESARFLKHCGRAWTWEKFLRNQNLQSYVLGMSTLMPAKWRQNLKTPV